MGAKRVIGVRRATTEEIISSKLPEQSCLVISGNGDGEKLEKILLEMGITPVPSGNGREGVAALERYKPKLIILFFHPEDGEDTLVFRAVQALCQQEPALAAVVISADVRAVERLLGETAGHCKVLADLVPDRLKTAMADLSNFSRRPRKAAQAALA